MLSEFGQNYKSIRFMHQPAFDALECAKQNAAFGFQVPASVCSSAIKPRMSKIIFGLRSENFRAIAAIETGT